MDRRHNRTTPIVGLALLILWALALVATLYSQGGLISSTDFAAGIVVGFVFGISVDRLLRALPRLGLIERRHPRDGR